MLTHTLALKIQDVDVRNNTLFVANLSGQTETSDICLRSIFITSCYIYKLSQKSMTKKKKEKNTNCLQKKEKKKKTCKGSRHI